MVDIASYVVRIWSFILCFIVSFQCNVLFFCVFVVSFFSLSPQQHFVPVRQEGQSRCLQFDSAHDYVSFPCAIPTHPISKTTGQFHQSYCYSLPPLQRPARFSIGTRPTKPRCPIVRVPFFGLSGALCDIGYLVGPGALTPTWPTW